MPQLQERGLMVAFPEVALVGAVHRLRVWWFLAMAATVDVVKSGLSNT
jgi:hypothetical protein